MLASAGLMSARDAKGANPPAAPSNVQATQKTDTSITITWDDNSVQEDNFVVYQSHNGGAYSQVGTPAANDTDFDDTGLTTGDTYQYKVSAENEAGESSKVESNSVTLEADTPDAPTGLSATTISDSQVDLSWTDNATNEDNYVIYRDGSLFDTIAANSTSYSATGLSEGTEYDWKVGAKNSSGTAFSSTVSKATQLAQPTDMAADNESLSDATRLTWTDNSAHEDNYEVYRNGSLHDTIAADSEQYDVLCPDANANWFVRAVSSSLPDSDDSGTVAGNDCTGGGGV